MQGCNNAVVGVAGESEGTGTVRVGFEGLDAVVDGWIRVEMLVAVLALGFQVLDHSGCEYGGPGRTAQRSRYPKDIVPGICCYRTKLVLHLEESKTEPIDWFG